MKPRPVKKLEPSRALGENAARIVQVRLDEMRSLAPKALEGKVKAQHDMRIAAKRLRYVLEVTGFCFGRPADAARRRARDLQDILGEIHDCDVMLPRVRTHLQALQASDAEAIRSRADKAPDLAPRLAAHAPNRTAYRGLDVLAVYLQARRGVLDDRFHAFWGRHEQTWVRLDRAVEGYLHRAREARRAEKAAEKARAEAEAAERAARQAEAQAEQARLDRERAFREAEADRRGREQPRPASPAPEPPA